MRIRYFLLFFLATCVLAPTMLAQPSIQDHLAGIQALSDEALAASRAAEAASTEADLKQHVDAVFATVWGVPSGLLEGRHGAAQMHGWKTRWQVSYDAFDEAFAERYGHAPPEITDPETLGIMGRGLAVRQQLNAIAEDENASEETRSAAAHTVQALNNVIGWMRMDDGVTKAERQPRVDLTYQWDAPSAFWQSTADTGWLHEAFAQAINILKTDYEGDLAMAHQHAAALTMLIEKYRNGLDHNGDGTIAPVMMEGGLLTALAQARDADF